MHPLMSISEALFSKTGHTYGFDKFRATLETCKKHSFATIVISERQILQTSKAVLSIVKEKQHNVRQNRGQHP